MVCTRQVLVCLMGCDTFVLIDTKIDNRLKQHQGRIRLKEERGQDGFSSQTGDSLIFARQAILLSLTVMMGAGHNSIIEEGGIIVVHVPDG